MSLPEDNQQLRKLSRAVMRGELSRSEYQQQRRRLIDSYTGDTGAADDVDTTNPGTLPAIPAQEATQPALPRAAAKNAKAATGPAAVAPASADGADHGDLWVGLAAVVAVLLVVAGALAWFW